MTIPCTREATAIGGYTGFTSLVFCGALMPSPTWIAGLVCAPATLHVRNRTAAISARVDTERDIMPPRNDTSQVHRRRVGSGLRPPIIAGGTVFVGRIWLKL